MIFLQPIVLLNALNILFVTLTFRLFDHLDCGAANRSTLFVEALSKVGHVDVVSFLPEPLQSNIEGCDVLQIYPPHHSKSLVQSGRFERYHKKVRFALLPFSPCSHWLPDAGRVAVIDRLMAEKKYDIVACRYMADAVHSGLYKYADRLVMDVDDHPVSVLKRDLQCYPPSNVFMRWLQNYRAYALGVMVKRFLRKVRVSFYSNILEPTSSRSIFLHNTTMQEQHVPDITPDTPLRLLIVGWLGFAPNREGALHFAEKVFPKIRQTIPNAELHIAGKTRDKQVTDRLNAIEGVRALGYVDDIAEEYRQCRVVIVPVYQGAGTSVKFAEGMMMNRPMVATPMGVRGFDTVCRAGSEYLLANNDDSFAANVVHLLQSPEEAEAIAHRAYAVGQQKFSRQRFCEIVADSISKAWIK